MRTIIILVLCLLVAACGVTMKPGSEPRNRRDIPPGPGIMTGEQGEFVLYRLQRTPPASKPSNKGTEPSKGEGADKASGG